MNAQFNYQAIVKDNNGQILTNNQVKIKFSISYESTSVSPVFVEEHTLTTPADGVINISVGNGTIIDGSFSNIDWSNDVFMKEELDTGNGYQDMGTKQFASVPLAQFANQVYGLNIYENIDANNQITSPDTIELGFSDSNLIIKSELISATNLTITNIVSATGITAPYIYAGSVTSSLIDVYSLTSSNIMANTVTASYFVGDGSGLTNISGSVGVDSNGNILIVDNEPTMTTSQVHNILIGSEVASNLTDGYQNIGIGSSALASATLTSNNVAIGPLTLSKATDTDSGMNIAIGNSALENIEDGYVNVAIGTTAMQEVEEGQLNIAIGAGALEDSKFSSRSVAIGVDALNDMNISGPATITLEGGFEYPSGVGNTAIGDGSMRRATGGSYNTAVGQGSLANNTTGINNVALGSYALNKSKTGNTNLAVGWGSLMNTENGQGNTAVGGHAGQFAGDGAQYNTYIGVFTSSVSNVLIENSTAIGAYASVTTSNTIQLGDEYIELVNTSGVVSASGFVGDGSGLTNITGSVDIDSNGNIVVVDLEPSLNGSQKNNILMGAGVAPQLSNPQNDDYMGSDNVAIGSSSMASVTTSFANIAIGTESLASVTSGTIIENNQAFPTMNNLAIGKQSLLSLKKGASNVAIGNFAMSEGDDFSFNTAIGVAAMQLGKKGKQNVAIGPGALLRVGNTVTETLGYQYDQNGNPTNEIVPLASSNVAIGRYSMYRTDSGYENIAVGRSSLLTNLDGYANVAVGDRALYDNKSNFNTGVGKHSLYHNEQGDLNTSIGYFSGSELNSLRDQNDQSVFDGSMNTFIGAYANTVSNVLIDNSTAIGAYAIVTTSNTIQLGDEYIELVNTSGIVSATAFYGDGSGLTNVGGYSDLDENGNLFVVDQEPTMTVSRVNNILVGRGIAPGLLDGYNNVAVGTSALASATTTHGNIAIGPEALESSSSFSGPLSTATSPTSALNVAIGWQSLNSMEDGFVNIAVGTTALKSAKEGTGNIAIGAGAIEDATFSENSVAIGQDALHQGNVNRNSIAIGKNALFNVDSDFIDPDTNDYMVVTDDPSTTLDESLFGMPGNIALGTGSFASPGQQTPQSGTASFSGGNISLGHMAMYNASKFAWDNIALGSYALANLNEGEWGNIGIGWKSQHSLEDGAMNIAIGARTMGNSKEGYSNVAIGNASMFNANQLDYNTAVGFQSLRDMNINAETNGTVTMTHIDGFDYQSGISNTALGAWAMRRATGGSDNTAIGDSSLIQLENGIENVAVGAAALKWTKQTSYNVAIGVQAMENLTGTATYTDDNNVVQFLNSSGNTAIGTRAMQNANYGSHNVAIGDNALLSNSAFDNVAVGSFSMSKNDTGDSNVAVGTKALHENIDGDRNTATGERSLEYNTYGSRNTAFGHHSSGYNTVGNFNTSLGIAAARDAENIDGAVAVGYHAMTSMTNDPNSYADNTISENTAIGYFAMSGDENIVNTGVANTALGYMTLTNLSSGNFNTAIGPIALFSNTTGSSNIALGDEALKLNVSGNQNIAIGKETLSANLVSGNIGIGFKSLTATVSGSHNVSIGEESMLSNVSGFKNVAIGASSMRSANSSNYQNTSVGHDSSQFMNGNNNTAVGAGSGVNIDDPNNHSNNNTFLGKMTGAVDGTAALQNSTAIGSDAQVSSSNSMVFGNQNVNKWAFGLATTDSGKVIQVGDDTTNGNGAYLTAGGTWTNGSSILFKTNFIDLSSEWILDKISKLNIRKWDYKNTNETHIGPTSEEFINLFGVGIENENSHISTIDVSGVALKGVQALIDENKVQKEQLESQNDLINELYNRILALEKKISE